MACTTSRAIPGGSTSARITTRRRSRSNPSPVGGGTWASRLTPPPRPLLITADAGGSNSARSRLWNVELQRFADRTGLAISVSHFPPGTSKWNKIEHRLFCHITENWRGRPLVDHETVVQLIGNVRTRTGLTVKAKLDKRAYPIGIKVPDADMETLRLTPDDFHGDWNYTIHPRLGVTQ